MSLLDIISIPYQRQLKIVTHTWLIQVEYRALSMVCLSGGFFGQIKPLFAYTHRVTILLPMSEMQLRRFW